MKAIVVVVASILIGLVAMTAMAEQFSVYKWVDENGVPQYTDRPPSTAMVERTKIYSRRTNPAAVDAHKGSLSDRIAAQKARRKDQKEDRQKAEQIREKTLEERAKNCEQAREREKLYMGSRRLYRPLPNGEREYLSDDELDAARTEAHQAVREWCD